MATGTDRLFNHEQGERLIKAVEEVAIESGGGGMAMAIEIPQQVDFELTYTGSPVTARFSNVNVARVLIENATNTEPGVYVATANLKGLQDKWTDNTNAPKRYEYVIRETSGAATSWANASDTKIDEILTAMEAGTVDPMVAYGWMVGDERVITLPHIPKFDEMVSGERVILGENHAEQSVTLAIMGTNEYDLSGGGKSNLVIGFKNSFIEPGAINWENTNTGSWGGSMRRKWCEEILYPAIPLYIRKHLKRFNVVSAEVYNGTTLQTSSDYLALFAEKEVFGARTNSNQTEADALVQIPYYAVATRRQKLYGDSSNLSTQHWWLRSPYSASAASFCFVYHTGSAAYADATNTIGLAPFGCL